MLACGAELKLMRSVLAAISRAHRITSNYDPVHDQLVQGVIAAAMAKRKQNGHGKPNETKLTEGMT
jgi:hypothetical protein